MEQQLVIPSNWALPDEIKQRLGFGVGRQRLMSHDGHLLLVLHEVPEPEEVSRRGALFWRNAKGEWFSSSRGKGFDALKQHVKSYADAIARLDQRLDDTPEAQELFEILSESSPIQRAAKNLHQVLQSTREAAGSDKALISLRDEAYDTERAAELLYTDAKNALDFDIARRAEEQAAHAHESSRAAHKLNLLAAVFLPVTAVASILGVSIPTGLESWLTPGRFWLLIALSIIAGLILKRRIAKT